jgi:hypothetical protein
MTDSIEPEVRELIKAFSCKRERKRNICANSPIIIISVIEQAGKRSNDLRRKLICLLKEIMYIHRRETTMD